MAHHTITLNYGNTGFHPDTDELPVKTGDTISFQLGTAPPDSKFKIMMDDPKFFSPAEVEDSATKMSVLKAVKTTYRCQLFDAAGNLLSRPDQGGGGVRPN